MLVKIYGPSSEGEKRYSPAECTGAVNIDEALSTLDRLGYFSFLSAFA